MSKRTRDGTYVRHCFNRLHDQIVAHVLPAENGDHGSEEFRRKGGAKAVGKQFLVDVSRAPLAVKQEFSTENPQSLRNPTRRYYICNVCYEYFAHQSQAKDQDQQGQRHAESENEHDTRRRRNPSSNGDPGPGAEQVRDSERVNAVLQQMSDFDDEELAKVARFLAKSQKANIKNDMKNLNASNAPVDELCKSDVQKWVSERNVVLKEFLEELSSGSNASSSDIAKAIEQNYHVVDSRTILPLALAENLVSYSVTNSKLSTDINAANSPCGSYTYLMNWLEKQASEPEPVSEGDILAAFDNDQVIGKSYHARHDNKLKTSVITSVCFAEVGGSLQKEERLKPAHWQSPEKIREHADEILENDSELNKAVNKTHYQELYNTLDTRIQKVAREQSRESDNLTDEIDKEVGLLRDKRDWRVCSECKTKNLRSKRICCSCGHRLRAPQEGVPEAAPKKSTRDSTTYTRITFQEEEKAGGNICANEASAKTSVNAGDPIFINPNSHQSLIVAFKDIGRQLGIKKYTGGDREWASVTCDGLPYTLGLRVIKETFSCAVCREAIFTARAFDDHMKKEHGDHNEDREMHLEFDWLLLKIGHGHVEMNMLRSFFELNWEVFVKDVAMSMGFCSEAAQKYAKRGSDHHKSWELLQIMFFGCIDELLVPYVRDSIQTNTEPTPNGFMEWSQQIKNKRYKYMQEQILTYAQAIFTMRKGIRHNDMSKVMSGRIKFSNVFHARNHPKYQLIEVMELVNFLSAPKEVKEFLTKYQSISTSGDPSRCEDMDFVLENINKKSKSWIPKGMPTEKHWTRIFKNLTKFDDLRSGVLNRSRKSDDSQSQETYISSHAVREEDVTAWRAHLRESEFLLQPLEDVPFVSVSRDELAGSLLTFAEQARHRRRFFVESLFSDEGYEGLKPRMVFVTQEEVDYHNDVHNQTKDQIASRIRSTIQTLDDECVKSSLLQEWESSVKSKKKEDFIAFFQRVQEEVDQQGEFIQG